MLPPVLFAPPVPLPPVPLPPVLLTLASEPGATASLEEHAENKVGTAVPRRRREKDKLMCFPTIAILR
jgi:hypothetical protein